ncbi:MAG: transposase [Lachnospiraceae bacterium]|nr:transposase [Muribaculaceae bacterium]MCM1412681.1 transposase [Lachnospiraceae bacterium]
MRAKAVTAEEQYRLIMECRASGMTDYQWCVEHNIKPGTFYNWVKRLRQSGNVDIPASAGNREPARQDIVEIHLMQPSVAVPTSGMLSDAFTGTSQVPGQPPMLELSMADATLRIPQGTDPAFLEQVLFMLKGMPC